MQLEKRSPCVDPYSSTRVGAAHRPRYLANVWAGVCKPVVDGLLLRGCYEANAQDGLTLQAARGLKPYPKPKAQDTMRGYHKVSLGGASPYHSAPTEGQVPVVHVQDMRAANVSSPSSDCRLTQYLNFRESYLLLKSNFLTNLTLIKNKFYPIKPLLS